MTKTPKQFKEENLNKSDGYFTCNRVFSYKQWFDEERTIYVAAEYDGHSWEAIHAEYADTGEAYEMVCTRGNSKSDLIDMIEGC